MTSPMNSGMTDEWFKIEESATVAVTSESEMGAVSELVNDIYNADKVEINIAPGTRMLAEKTKSIEFNEQGMNIEIIVSGIKEELLQFEEDPK